jgi:hypothetical protein
MRWARFASILANYSIARLVNLRTQAPALLLLAPSAGCSWAHGLFSLTPGGWIWFFCHAGHWFFFKHAQGFLNGAFQLRIVAGDYFFGPVLDIDVGRDAFVLDRPFSFS